MASIFQFFPPARIARFLYHSPRLIVLFRRLMADPRVPFRAKIFVYLGLAYFLFPLDFIKDFPLIYFGYLDDIVVLYLCLRAFVRRVPQLVLAEHVEAIAREKGGASRGGTNRNSNEH